MAEPSTTGTLVVTAGIGLASFFPGIDGNALVGAFAGATLFVLSAKELNLITRLLYLMISLIMGYIAAPEIVANSPIQESGVAGFLAGVLCITITLKLTKHVDGMSISDVLKGGKSK